MLPFWLMSSCRSDQELVPPGLNLDQDGDGLTPNEGDCDDADVTVHPGSPELCDDIDHDCDGVVEAAHCPDAMWAQYTAGWSDEDDCRYIPNLDDFGALTYTGTSADGESAFAGTFLKTDIIALQDVGWPALSGACSCFYAHEPLWIEVTQWVSDDGGALWIDGRMIADSSDPELCASAVYKGFILYLRPGWHRIVGLSYNEPGETHQSISINLSEHGVLDSACCPGSP